ncbi:MAG: YqiA/YcfP family alpha/beta fold hydrolase [Myxococcota bacterium]|jgi:hypothetical protein|nr:YqiA/YcfP family alpha/beta fold hydrolase [Myxococcota bacterium]
MADSAGRTADAKLRVQFIHGLESSPQSTKAMVLAKHFDAITPAMDTTDFESCVGVQHAEIERFAPDVLVGSSYGGAVAVALLERGLWHGPTLLLAQAARHYDDQAKLPTDVSVWLVHGTGDTLIPQAESRELAATGSPDRVRYIEIEDDHPLRKHATDGSLVRWVRELHAADLAVRG